MNSEGTSLTTIIPNDSGPKACSRMEKDTFPGQVISLIPQVSLGSSYHFSGPQALR